MPYMPVLPLALPHEFSLLMPLSLFSYVPELKVNMACKNKAKLFHI